MNAVAIEPLAAHHLDEILAIEESLFPAPWTRAMFEQEVEETWLSRSYVAIAQGHVVGYIISWFLRGEVHILNLAVGIPQQRQGIGRRLLRLLLDEARRTQANLVTLEVRASNHAAKLLYIHMGFAPVGIRRRYYRDNNEDAIVMTKRFENA